MYGEQYYKDRLFDIYDFSPIKYLYGEGELLIGELAIRSEWELVVPVTGKAIFNLFNNEISNNNILGNQNSTFKGLSNCGTWEIRASGIFIFETRFNSYPQFATVIKCMSREINLRRIGIPKIEVSHIEGLISNFDFIGSEGTREGTQFSLNQIRASVGNKEAIIRSHSNKKQIIDQIGLQRIDRAILSSIFITCGKGENIDKLTPLLSSICSLLSIISVNACFCPVIFTWAENELTEINIRDLISCPYHHSVLIDNFKIMHGITNVLNNCFESFCFLDSSINMQVFVNSLLGMYEGKFMENKIAGLLMLYEYILTRYLKFLGHNQDKVKDLNIQVKLQLLNKHMKFIPSRLLGDNLRANLRNPLFHTGELSILDSNDQYNIYCEYFDLIVRIVLRLIGYTGEYISPIDYEVRPI